jgi:hypothetical protein
VEKPTQISDCKTWKKNDAKSLCTLSCWLMGCKNKSYHFTAYSRSEKLQDPKTFGVWTEQAVDGSGLV